jgi:hypothetical protein
MHAPANAYACARRLRYATPACQHAPFGRLSARFGLRPHLSAHFALRARCQEVVSDRPGKLCNPPVASSGPCERKGEDAALLTDSEVQKAEAC